MLLQLTMTANGGRQKILLPVIWCAGDGKEEKQRMNYYDYNTENGFEFFNDDQNSVKKSKPRKFWKKTKKFFRRVLDKVVDTILSTVSQIALRYFDKKFEKSFA